MTEKHTVKEQLTSMKTDLQQLRDEIRVKLHLGGMDLRDRFEKLEPQVRDFEQRAERAGGDVGAELREGFEHLKAAFRKLRDDLERPTS
ncbi:MAG: hypothetical protein K8H88_13650 [Sandaracinaceae bacterium]|nr:hypothetical protein [Sandaracinaceae bacterium]